jgi:hypothetical protein
VKHEPTERDPAGQNPVDTIHARGKSFKRIFRLLHDTKAPEGF